MHGAVLVIFIGSLDKRKAVDVTNVCFAATSEHIKTANILLKLQADPSSHFLLSSVKIDRVADLLTRIFISLDFTINGRASTSLSVGVVRSHRVHFDVKAVCRQEFLVQVAAIRANSTFVARWKELRAGRLCLAE